MLLDIIDNLPQLCLSTKLSVQDVPSYDALHKLQKKLCELCGTEPKVYKSTFGNHFYVNDIHESIARVWQVERWKEFHPSELTPMFSRGHQQFYIDEVSQLQDGVYVIPHNWIIYDKELCANCSLERWSTVSCETYRLPATAFQFNYADIVAWVGQDIHWCEMPNPLCKLADGDDLYVVMVPLWGNDVSGNKSKQYNKHINIYAMNGCLPGQLLQQVYFMQFVSTSPHAISPEQFSAIWDQINDTHTNPIRCYNADTHRPCGIILRTPGLPADNPQQSEEASHIGGNANYPCHKCKICGTSQEKEQDELYHEFYSAGELCNRDKIVQNLEEQLHCAAHGVAQDISNMQTETGTKDKITQHCCDILLEKAKEMKKKDLDCALESVVNKLCTWLKEQPGLNPSQDTPVELLHTILLGVIKYVWHMLNTSWSDTQRNLFAIHLQSMGIDGLSIPPIRAEYMTQYHNNLIGKHFKTLMQTLPFHVHGLVTPNQFVLVKAVSALSPMLWVNKIENMNQYLVFEGFNAVFRLCFILSNHQSPSHGKWVQAGAAVLKVLQAQPILQRHLGWVPTNSITPSIKIQTKMNMLLWKETHAYTPSRSWGSAPLPTSHWHLAKSVTAQSGDRCITGSWIVGCSKNGDMIFGRILELLYAVDLSDEMSQTKLVSVDEFVLGERLHPDLQCPVL
ncbi:hypothetical protein EDD85DRAFT_924070 [Armillaria nabsnona]|nr:hypothetical protein EDD85DRAFT_924070 [Armillaria nabsnona]